MCPRNCLQTEPISCCFKTHKIILIQQHKAAPRLLQSDEGHYESRIKSTIHGIIDMKLCIVLKHKQITTDSASSSEAYQFNAFAVMLESYNCSTENSLKLYHPLIKSVFFTKVSIDICSAHQDTHCIPYPYCIFTLGFCSERSFLSAVSMQEIDVP